MNKIQPFPTLYSRKANGKIQKWNQYIITNNDTDIIIVTEFGFIDGKITIHNKPIKFTKSKRNYIDEALEIVRSTWNEKLNREGYVQSIDDAEHKIIIRPMLSNKYDKNKFSKTFPKILQPKLDGNRCIVHKKNNEIIIESRNGSSFNFFNHIKQDLQNLYNDEEYNNLYLDGELYTPELDFNIINGLTNKSLSLTINEEQDMKKIKFYIFDCINLNNIKMINLDRLKILESIFLKYKFENLILVDSILVNDNKNIDKYLENYISNGYEGIILRNPNGIYQLNKRTNDLLKYKKFQDEEFEIVGFEESNEEISTVIWICKSNINPKLTFNVRPKGSIEYRSQLLIDAKKYIGYKLTVVFQNYTDTISGIPRFPVGRDFRYNNDL